MVRPGTAGGHVTIELEMAACCSVLMKERVNHTQQQLLTATEPNATVMRLRWRPDVLTCGWSQTFVDIYSTPI